MVSNSSASLWLAYLTKEGLPVAVCFNEYEYFSTKADNGYTTHKMKGPEKMAARINIKLMKL